MSNLKRIDDEEYILNLFKNLSRKRSVPVIIGCKGNQVNANMIFSARRGYEPSIKLYDNDVSFKVRDKIEVSFYSNEVVFLFQTRITSLLDNTFSVENPKIVFSSFRRLMSRYTVKIDEEALIIPEGSIAGFKIINISSSGLAFEAKYENYYIGQILKRNIIKIGNNIEAFLDGEIRSSIQKDDDVWIYGMNFKNIDWGCYYHLFKYIMENVYPKLKPIRDVPKIDTKNLLEKALNGDGKASKLIKNLHEDRIAFIQEILNKPSISCCYIYYKNQKPAAIGSIIRIYNNTFLGQPNISTLDEKINSRASTEIYMGLADSMINNTTFQYYVKYITNDLSWHDEIFQGIDGIINNCDRFVYDKLQLFECNANMINAADENKCIIVEKLDKPDEFIEYCKNSLMPIITACYSYNSKDFELNEIRQIFRSIEGILKRKLWKISLDDNIIAFAVAEVYVDAVSFYNSDICRIYFAQDGIDLRKLLQSFLPEVKSFFEKYNKVKFNILFKAWVNVARDIKITGLNYICTAGRVIISKEGMSEYKKLLANNFINYIKYYPLTHPQLSIWYTEKVYPNTSFGCLAQIVRFKEKVNYNLLEKAINLAIEKNDGLRLRMVEFDVQPRQYVSKYRYKKLHIYNFDRVGNEYGLETWDENNTSAPFELIDSELYYFALIKLGENEGGFYIKVHHLISDAWTMTLIINRIIEYYSKLKRFETIPKRKSPSYLEYILSEDEYKRSDRFLAQKEFWNKKFETVPELISLKSSISRQKSIKAKRKTFTLSQELTTNIHAFCSETKASPSTVFLSMLAIYLNRVTSMQDVVIGVPVLNRSTQREKDMTGMFISMIPVRMKVEPTKSFSSFIQSVAKEWKQLLKNQKYPYELIQKDFREMHKSSENLFDITLSYQNVRHEKNELTGDYEVSWNFNGNQTESLTIHVSDWDDEGEYTLHFDYLEDLFTENEIDELFEHYKNLIEDATINRTKKVSQLEILSESEKNKLLYEFNDTKTDYPKGKTIQQLFEEQVELGPDETAITYKDKSISYKDLNDKANQLARLLISKGIDNEEIIGIMADRSLEMVIGILAILKSGGAYMPIDPKYPLERIRHMLDDSGAKILLFNNIYDSKLEFEGGLIDIGGERIYIGEKENVINTSSPNNIAYVMYTSGSTGKPKGTMVLHKNVVRLVKDTNYIKFYNNDRILQTGSVVFDASTFEIWGALLNGLGLYIVGEDIILNAEKLASALNEYKITTLWLTSPLFNQLSQQNSQMFRGLRSLLVGGDVLSPSHIKAVREGCKNLQIINGYGPTENTTFSTCFHINKDFEDNIPIGTPISNSSAYILDKFNNLLPIGVAGELHVGGDGVARGYLKRPELTKEKFISNPFVPEDILYKTGDLARWLEDGNIEFLGRIDQQVKIRGFRIEIQEIENQLLKIDSIKDSVIIVKADKNNNKYLCAYIVAERELLLKELREQLLNVLPEYMVPSYFVQLERLPLTPNGKVDKTALPEIDKEIDSGVAYDAPRNKIEEQLVSIWQDVLDFERIGINDNFFELGGDSLKAINLVAKIHKQFNLEVLINEIFKNPNIKDFAKKLNENVNMHGYKIISQVEEREYYSVSSAQKRMYMVNSIDSNSISYNMPASFKISGNLDKAKLISALNCIVKRHDSFRTSFHMANGEIVQKIHKKVRIKIDESSCSLEQIKKHADEFIRPFDLSKAPILRIKLLEISETESLLLLDMHHIISDGISLGIFIKELSKLYESERLSPLKIQYKDYSIWHNDFQKSEKIKEQKKYWLDLFADEIPVLNLPSDYLRPAVQSFEGGRFCFSVSREVTAKLNNLANRTGATLYMVLLSAYNVLLYKYTSQEDIVVGTPIAGRTHADLNGIIGMFVNTLAMRNKPKADLKFSEFLEEVKQNSLKAYENQDFQFEELVSNLNLSRDMGRNPLFDTMFILQNIDMPTHFQTDGIDVALSELEFKISKFDLTLQATVKDENIYFDFEYCSKLYKEETIKRMSGHFINVINYIIDHEESKLSEIEMLSEKEKYMILNEFNKTETEYSKYDSVQKLFEEQVKRTPDNVAVVFGEKYLSYDELNKKSNRLARYLRNKNVKRGDLIGIMVERSLEMIIGIFGILKSGAAYLPIDPEYPKNRVEYMLEDSGTKMLLINKSLCESIFFAGEKVDLFDEQTYEIEDDLNLENTNSPRDLAYVIYTSGSTGNPKGVMIEHRSVNNFIKGITDRICFNEGKVILSVTTISFDIFVLETLLSFAKGLKVIIANEKEQRDGNLLSKLILKNGIDMIQTTPSRMQLLMGSCEWKTSLENVKEIMLGGEAFPESLLKSLKLLPHSKIYNMYGPTETTVWSLVEDLTELETVKIGRPIANTKAYIVDKNNTLLPVGIPGELCLGGDGLSRGYLNRAELTDEKFIENPHVKGVKYYKTGDMAKWLPNGKIDFIGRMDNQVKIRGYRIELGEIENLMLKNKNIKEVAVIDRVVNETKCICAYYTSEEFIPIYVLREYLLSELPEYMIPSHFIRIDNIPMTPNGKIDRKALPIPKGEISTGRQFIAPANDTEKQLANIWQEVLGVVNVSVEDDFFELGGDSLAVIRVISMAFKYDWKLDIQDFYKLKTIRNISTKVFGCTLNSANNQFIKDKNAYFNKLNKTTNFDFNIDKNKFKNVLLTGATGFLGAHVLRDLLDYADVRVYCLIRGANKEECNKRLNDLLDYYFNGEYKKDLNIRVFAVKGDVSEKNLGLSDKDYFTLVEKVGLIIHAAALVKHFGNYEDFEKINVLGTQEVISFSEKNDKKLCHVSTTSVSGSINTLEGNPVKFTENNYYIGQDYLSNVYVRSKFEAEGLVYKAIERGLDALVFRVGNLTGRYSDGYFQRNIEENKFYNILKSFIKLKAVPADILDWNVEFTPIEKCSKALVEIVFSKKCTGRIFHLFNDKYIKMSLIIEFLKEHFYKFDILNRSSFIEYVRRILDEKDKIADLTGIINELNSDGGLSFKSNIDISSQLSNNFLKELGIEWPQIDQVYLKKIISHMEINNFI